MTRFTFDHIGLRKLLSRFAHLVLFAGSILGSLHAFGQTSVTVVTQTIPTPAASKNALPMPVTPQSLTGLEVPPNMVIAKPAIPQAPVLSNIAGAKDANVTGQAMDLITLYQEAAFSDPVMTSARFQYVASQEQYWQGLSLLLPQVNAAPGWTRYYQHAANNSSLQTYPGNARVFGQKNYTVTLTQPLINVASLELYKVADLTTKIADLQFYQAQQDLIIRVSQAYFDVLTSQDNVVLYQEKMSLIKRQLDQAQAKFDAGLATIVDVNTAQANYDLANSQEIISQADLIVKRGVLEQLVGHPVPAVKPLAKNAQLEGVAKDPRTTLKNPIPSPAVADSVNPKLPAGQTLNDWIHQAENANFNVLAGKLNVDVAEATYRGALAANYPTLNFGATAGYNTNNGSTYSTQPSQTNIYNNTVGLTLNIPIYSGGYNTSVIRQNAALLDKAKSDYDNLRRTAAQNVRQAFTGFYGGLATVKAYEAAEKSGVSALESSQLGFEVGTLINLDVLVALDSLITTRAQLTQSRYSTLLNAIKLKSTAGTLSDEDLMAINTLLR
ncbi:TolC family protein [Polynucleobacter paneuropaeus]|nr:TolC family protein [Polynucleobacter paneuropaeus]